MARGETVGFVTNSGVVPAIVEAQYDTNGDVVADGTAASNASVTSADLLLLGAANGRRAGKAKGTDVNQWNVYTAL